MASPVPGPDLLRGLLRDVSRSFHTTLRVLPAGVRRPIALGYLLARATDTLADTEVVPVAARLEALETLRRRIAGERAEPVDFSGFLGTSPGDATGTAAERVLLGRIEEAISVLGTLSSEDQAAVREVLGTITGGQALDLERFAGAGAGTATVVALQTAVELDDYTYRVAGCVGEFWTRISRRHLFPRAAVDAEALMTDGRRFGQGLQLVNILRDLPKDLRMGRCYLPREELASAGVRPEDLLEASNEARMRPVYDRWLGVAEGHLVAGWRYTNALPSGQVRLRLASAWPVLIGWRTLDRLREARILDATRRVKVTRREVRQILLGSLWRLPFRGAWARQGPQG